MYKHYKLFTIVGSLMLFLGGCFYLLYRPESYIAHIILNNNTLVDAGISLPGSGSIPSFLHTIAFSMLTIAFLKLNIVNICTTALFWFCINVVYELFSATEYASQLGILFVSDTNDVLLSLYGAAVFILITQIHMRYGYYLAKGEEQ